MTITADAVMLPHNTRALFLDSPGALAAAFRSGAMAYYGGRNFSGYDQETALDHLEHGNESAVAAAERLLDDVDAEISTPATLYAPAPAGAYYVTPEVIAGLPCPMRRKQPASASTSGPVRMYADLVSSAGIPASQLDRRATAILALASKLSTYRPVDLWGAIPTGDDRGARNFLVTFHISPSPVNLSLAAGAMGPGAIRGIAYAVAQAMGWTSGQWAWLDGGARNREAYVAIARRVLDLAPEDLYIPPPYVGDDIARDPVAWIRQNLNRLQEQEA